MPFISFPYDLLMSSIEGLNLRCKSQIKATARVLSSPLFTTSPDQLVDTIVENSSPQLHFLEDPCSLIERRVSNFFFERSYSLSQEDM